MVEFKSTHSEAQMSDVKQQQQQRPWWTGPEPTATAALVH